MLEQRYGLLGGWPTSRLIHFDGVSPGVIARVLSSGPARRQAVFALLASELISERALRFVEAEPDEEASFRRAELIHHGSVRDILTELLGVAPPDGLAGALERVGLNPMLRPARYQRLIEIFTDPGQRRVAEAFRYVPTITSTMLGFVDLLPGYLLHANVLTRLESGLEAQQLADGFAFARSVNSKLTDAAIYEAVGRMRSSARLDELLARLIRRADLRLAEPVPADRNVRPLFSVRDMIESSHTMRNCLHTDRKIVNALRCKAAYAIFGENEAVMEFARLSNGDWLFVAAYGPRNGALPFQVEQAIYAKVHEAGVAFLPPVEEGHGPIGALIRPFDPIFLEAA